MPGDNGKDGERGKDGLPGPAGPAGDAGLKGETGRPGNNGLPGKRGDPGPQGNRGAAGTPGDMGPIGLEGSEGKKGERGPRGDKGGRGKSGPRGEDGSPGPGGINGGDGTKGFKGPLGIPVCTVKNNAKNIKRKSFLLCIFLYLRKIGVQRNRNTVKHQKWKLKGVPQNSCSEKTLLNSQESICNGILCLILFSVGIKWKHWPEMVLSCKHRQLKIRLHCKCLSMNLKTF